MNTVNEKNLILTRAKSAVLSRDFATASRLYKQLLKSDPSNVEYLRELGSIYVKNGEDAKAIPYYEQIITFYPHYVEAMTSLGGIYRRLKRYEESIEILQKALDEDRQTESVNYNLGFTYKEMGNYDDAIEAFEIVISENPSDVLAYNHLGKIYFEKKEYQKAILSYKKGLQVDQNHPILNYNLAVCYDEAKMYTEAIRCYEAALRAKPGWVDAIRDFSNLLIKCQKTKEASDLVHHSIELYPNDANLLCLLGRIYINQFDYDSAIKTFKRAETYNGNDIKILSGLAEALEKGERPQEALDSVIRALELEPDNRDLKKQYIHTLLSAEEYDAASINVNELINEPDSAKDVEVLDLYEQYSICVKDEENARKYSDQINKINKHYKNHIIEAAQRYSQIGDNDMAEKKTKEFIAREIRNPVGYITLGKVYANMGNLQDAMDAYDKSRSLRKPNVFAEKQLKKLKEQISGVAEPEPYLEEEQPEELVSEIPAAEEAVAENEEVAEYPENEEDDFDFSQLGGNVPMQEALLEDEDEFFNQFEDTENADDTDNTGPEMEENSKTEAGESAGDDLTDSGEGSREVSADNARRTGSSDSDSDDDDFDFGQFDGTSTDSGDDDDNLWGDNNSLQNEKPDSDFGDFPSELQPGPEPLQQPQEPQFAPQPEPQYQQPPQPQYQPNPYAEEMQKQLQNAMMQSSRYAMDTAMEAQKLARQLADEQEILKNRLNEMEEKQNDLEEKQNSGYFAAASGNAGDVNIEEEKETIGEEIVDEDVVDEDVVDETPAPVIDEIIFPTVDEMLQELSIEPEDLIPEVDDIEDFDLDSIVDEAEENPEVEEQVEEQEEQDEEIEPIEQVEEQEEQIEPIEQAVETKPETFLPVVEKVLEDEDKAAVNAPKIEMFKKLISLSDYLPEEEKENFLVGKQRMQMEYLISKMSGKPGLLKTSQSLRKAGVLNVVNSTDTANATESEENGISNHTIKKVISTMKKLSLDLQDKNLAKALCNSADNVLEKIELEDEKSRIFA